MSASPIHCTHCGEARLEGDFFCSCGATRPRGGWAAEAPPPMMIVDEAPTSPEAQPTVGGYQLTERIADRGRVLHWVGGDRRGRKADVWLFSATPREMEDLEAHVKAASAVKDPGLRHPRSWGRTPVGVTGTWFVAVPRAVGPDLSSVRVAGPVEPLQAVDWFVGAFGALAALHRAGLVFGRLLPQDLVVQDGRLVLPSLSLVYGPEVGRVPGQFSAPEDFLGPPSPASDVYALGVMLHGALTGAWPFDALTPPAARSQVPALKISWPLTHLLWDLTSPDPGQRPGSLAAAHQLHGVLEELWRHRQ